MSENLKPVVLALIGVLVILILCGWYAVWG